MENKDIERKLQESVENIETREFSEIWEEIKGDIKPAPKNTRRKIRWWVAAASVAGAIAICAVTLPKLVPSSVGEDSSAPAYLQEELQVVPTEIEAFSSALEREKISCLDLTKYVVNSSCLYETKEGVAKGGKLELTDNASNSTFYLTIQLYGKDVVVDKYADIVYEQVYSVNGITFEYRLKDSYPENSIYIYEIKAEHQSTQYYMGYTCFTEDITPFLDGLFE